MGPYEIVATNHVDNETMVIMVPNSMSEAKRVLHILVRAANVIASYDETMWIHSEHVSFWIDGDCVFELEIVEVNA